MIPEKDNLEELFISFLSGNASESEREHVNSILSESEEARKLLVELSQIWDATGIVNNRLVETDLRYKKLSSRIRESQKFHVKYRTLLQYAAVITLMFFLGVTLSPYLFKNEYSTQLIESADTKITSPLGSKTKLLLADGTEVWLNAGSTLSYSSSYKSLPERKVYLDGEAFFEVQKNEKKPFTVMARGVMFKALGTSFNVKAYSNEPDIVATLVEGKISVSNYDKMDKEVILQPNESIKILRKEYEASKSADRKDKSPKKNATNDELSPVEGVILSKSINTLLYTSWKDSQWIIDNEELGSLAKKLERRYAVSIKFEDDKLKKIRFTGTLLEESLEQVLQIISFAAPIKYRVEGSTVILEKE